MTVKLRSIILICYEFAVVVIYQAFYDFKHLLLRNVLILVCDISFTRIIKPLGDSLLKSFRIVFILTENLRCLHWDEVLTV